VRVYQFRHFGKNFLSQFKVFLPRGGTEPPLE